MIKTSVKKPFTVLVAVIMIIALGCVSLSNMTADLLPDFSLPYMIVITTYPGAGPEKVESLISKPMESVLGTVSGVKNISSSSNDNYSMVQLEFEEETDMSAALVKVSNSIDTIESSLPAEAGTPTIMEISMDMMASMYLGVSYEGKDPFELSTFVEDELLPYLERQDGVANINSVGLVEQSILVELDEEKVQDLNDRILSAANKAFGDAYKELADAKQKLLDSEQELDDGWMELQDGYVELMDSRAKYEQSVRDFNDGKVALDNQIASLEAQQATMASSLDQKDTLVSGLTQASNGRDLATMVQGIADVQHMMSPTSTDLIADADGMYGAMNVIKYYSTNTDLAPLKAALTTAPLSSYSYRQLYAELTTGTSTSAIAAVNYTEASTAISTVKQTCINGIKTGIDSFNTLRTANGLAKLSTASAVYAPETITAAGIKTINDQYPALWASANANLSSAISLLKVQKTNLAATESQLKSAESQLDAADEQLDAAREQLMSGQEQIDEGWEQYYDGVKAFNKQRTEVLKNANADELVSLKTLSTLIYAQNFEMPAGYINDSNNNSWLIKVGQNFESKEDLTDIVLTNIHNVGDVRLSDIATVTYIDNIGEQYAKMNGLDAVLLAVFKSSSVSTNAVSTAITEAIDELEAKYTGLKVTTLLDQGEYIDLLVKSILESVLIGAALAVIILAIFLKDVTPTIVVAISIPLSMLLAIVCMYFTGLSLNIMTLAGLGLGVGMLVDNSIVVIEDIYRLRGLGYSAAKAAVVGAKEVAGPIISSTLTTICVFLPILFAKGMVKDLILPMCLTVTYCLGASLLIALSVVPASGSTLLKNSKEKAHPFFDKMMDVYGKSLAWCLKIKVVPIMLALALLGLSVWQVIRMGIVMIPNMVAEPIEITVNIPSDMNKETAYKTIDQIVEKIVTVDGVDTVGAMPSSAIISTVGTQSSGDYSSFIVYVMVEGDNPSSKEIAAVSDAISAQLKDFGVAKENTDLYSSQVETYDLDISLSTQSIDMSQLLGSGLSIKIYGNEPEKLLEISEDIMKIVAKVDGYENISNAQEDGAGVVHLVIDKDAAMRCGLSVAQIYADINTKLTEDIESTTLTVDGRNMDILVRNSYSVPNTENLLDLEFKTKETDSDGDSVTVIHKLSDFAKIEYEEGLASIERYNLSRYISVTADVKDGENATLLSRELEPLLAEYEAPSGYSVELGGESDTVNDMVIQMAKMMALGFLFIYLVMVAQFQSLLSPFIILFTIPLAFTGGLIALWLCDVQLSLLSLMGFMILMGTVVNNGIVFVDYANQLRIEGKERREALIETGKTRMRPILMTALTTILAMYKMALGTDLAGQLGKGMALVIMGGLLYATFMTLYIVPVVYDILFKRKPLVVDIEV